MDGAASPLHVHIGRNIPLHVHVKSKKKSDPSEASLRRNRRLEQSFAEMAAGRPSLRASSALKTSVRNSRMKALDWARASSSQGPWIPPPAKTSRTKMAWEGASHRLEITPVSDDKRDGTVLRMSDLGSDDGSAATIDNAMEPANNLAKKLNSLENEMDSLKHEVTLQRSLQELTDTELKHSRLALDRKHSQLQEYRQQLEDRRVENTSLLESLSQKPSPETNREVQSQRDELMKKLMEAEMDSSAAAKQAASLKKTLNKLETHLSSSMYVSELSHQREAMAQRLAEFDVTNRNLRGLLRSQKSQQVTAQQLGDQQEVLLKRLKESEKMNQRLLEQATDKDKVYASSKVMKDELSRTDSENQILLGKTEELGRELQGARTEGIEMQRNLAEMQLRWSREKDLLKKAAKQHKELALRNEDAAEGLQTKLEEANTQMHQLKNKVAKLGRIEVSASTMAIRVKELEETLEETKRSTKSALDSIGTQLMTKTRELTSIQLEKEKLRASVMSAEEMLKGVESSAHMKESSAHVEISQLQASISQYEGLVSEYKAQLEKSRHECEEFSHQLKLQQHETGRAKQEGSMEIEKLRLKMQHHLSDLDHLPEHLRDTEIRLREAQQKVVEQEKKIMEQTILVTNLSSKSDYRSEEADGLRDKAQAMLTETTALKLRLESTEKRLGESERHNRGLIATASKKEDNVLTLQTKVGELMNEVSSVNKQLDSAHIDSKRYCEQLKDKASTKELTSTAKIAELEAQLSRVNSSAAHMKRAKEECERRNQSRLSEMKERLEQANNSSRSMQNYIAFLKSSYSNVFNDSLSGYNPGSNSLSPLLH